MLKYAQSRANETLAQHAVAEFMASSAYDRHMARLRRLLNAQREQMAEAIAAHFPAGTRLSVPRGSMMLWVEMPAGTSAQAVFDTAIKQGIRVAPGSMFSNSNRFDHFLRISSGAPFTSQANEALRTLAAIVSAEAAKAAKAG
jgi:DNA-binding transcriptional MocR family regulator